MQLELSEHEVRYIFELLKKRPYEESATIIEKIRAQVVALQQQQPVEQNQEVQVEGNA